MKSSKTSFLRNCISGWNVRIAELVPERVIFRESCFTTDADKLNVYELFKQQCGWSEEEVYRNVYVL